MSKQEIKSAVKDILKYFLLALAAGGVITLIFLLKIINPW